MATASIALMAAVSSASAVAATQHWASSSTQVPYGTSQEFSGKAESHIYLIWEAFGTYVEMSCSSLTTSGTAENPSGGGAGTLAMPSIKLGSCAIYSQPGCSIQESSITLEGKPSTASVSGNDKLKYEGRPDLGILHIVGSKCGLAASYPVVGNLGATAQSGEPGVYVFDGASSELTIAGEPVTVEGHLGLSASSGGPLVLSSSASPGAPHWYRGSSAWNNLSTGKSSSFASNGALSFDLKAEAYSAPFEVSCSGTANSVSGSVENPSGGGAGTVSASFSFGGCTLPTLAAYGCSAQQPWNWKPVSGVATEVGGKPALEFQLAGANAPVLSITGKSCPIKGSYPIEGGLIASSAGDGIFTLSAGELSLAGEPAEATGTFALQRENTESLRLQP